ncbi:MraY family glycosyltransferase [Pseudoteredinibacter isoporae]|uniref:Fuc2NAc and GlcNAc transferase n=1 Tax=Pseudoteredinibacter isoporae TaxID=570281 RepID=A0A7X0JU73_9GAMM|nr:glycosyltransferase family 4 protein [Pseudoteredinibacter isoporae]MBB6521783.1 Fuc2NAc and GlcNAc transferase [Pseudoteredinibacter isoporae]NHO87329.1 glycosyltransferase family 4 protein [Pseudoteredinibacter isoporae]NIB23039.1 glycosyltransferase family 4 protein [Pseudoteredinibacter isoporae]
MMITLGDGLLLAVLCLSSWLMSHGVRLYALRANVVDVPSARSSHSTTTPRGGGLAIVAASILAALWLWQQERLANLWLLAIYLPAGLLGLFSFVDDHKPLSRRLRFFVHLACACLLLYLLPKDIYLPLAGYQIPIASFWMAPLSVLAITWMINLYNFMDGIDGIAGAEAISVLLGLQTIIYLQGGTLDIQLLSLSAIALGFLWINWAPAKLFMGDIGSCFLGLILVACACYCAHQYQINLWASLILLAAFIVDASWTLLYRMLTGQAWNEGHRSHSYQILSRKWQSHSSVVCAMLLFNTLWLLPLALLSTKAPEWAAAIFALACLPFLTIGLKFKAGHNSEL